jgi:hypothetical protein
MAMRQGPPHPEVEIGTSYAEVDENVSRRFGESLAGPEGRGVGLELPGELRSLLDVVGYTWPEAEIPIFQQLTRTVVGNLVQEAVLRLMDG